MLYFPLGVAGHVDHGKTTLVKALTSIDTDRLPEEKRRGMSIDIGFAFLDFPSENLRVEIIDLPGHERFIKNATCGLAPVWGLMLVVDACEGVMPQTLEHIRIARTFGINRLITVLSKIDKVDEETSELAKEEVKDLLSKEGLIYSGIYKVSANTGTGIEDLKKGILTYAKENLKDKRKDFFLFFVDSAFVVKGYGTVVRGSCVSGEVLEGEALVLEPLGVKCKVRKMQNHGLFVKEGRSGERLALNLPELDPSLVQRGHFLIKEGQFKKSSRVIVRLDSEMPKGLGYAFFGMREVSLKHRKLIENVYLLKLSEEVVTLRGYKGPVLNSSGEFLGGYEVLHPFPSRLSKRFILDRIHLLVDNPEEYLLLERGIMGLSPKDLSSFYGRPYPSLPSGAISIGNMLYHKGAFSSLKDRLLRELSESNGLVKVSQLTSKLRIKEEVLGLILKELRDYIIVEGYLLDIKSSNLEELDGYKKLMSLLSEGLKEERELLPLKEYLHIALRKGHAYSLGSYLYVSKELFEEYVNRLRSLGKEFSIAQAKEVLSFSRKYLIPLLEYMDSLGITKRLGDRRVFLR
jgi:selenocysteine-specific elongation factor